MQGAGCRADGWSGFIRVRKGGLGSCGQSHWWSGFIRVRKGGLGFMDC